MSATRPQEQPAAKGPEAPQRSSRENARAGGVAVLAILITLLAVFNLDEVKVHWVIGSGNAPLIIVVVISFLFGVVLTHFAERRSRRR